MQIVLQKSQAVQNIYKLYEYLYSLDSIEKEFAIERFKKGWVFVAANIGGRILFAPSKFVGYLNNSISKYENTKTYDADGRISNLALEKIYGREKINDTLLIEFKQLLSFLSIERNYETGKSIRFFFTEENVFDTEFSCFFICPTHIKGKKPEAFKRFLEKGIAAIGWDISNYEGLSWEQVEELIIERGFPDQSAALIAHRNLLKMKEGDIICCTNNNHGLLGIGIICSKRLYELGIHDAGNGDEKYDHYVKVSWIKPNNIPQKDINKESDEGWWEPYGTLKSKRPIPKYIEKILFKELSLQNPVRFTIENKHNVKSLNSILYGPPGTGKTYNTINYALSIIDGDEKVESILKTEGRIGLVKRYEELSMEGQIAFITFHQNYSYEEFIQGLRPKVEDSEKLVFEKKDGIFKRLSDLALKNLINSSTKLTIIQPSFEEVFDSFFEPLIEETNTIKVDMESIGYSFVLTRFNEQANNIEFTKQSGGKGHTIYIPTLKRYYEQPEIAHTQGLKYYYKPLVKAMLEKSKELVKTTENIERKKYVLIIDEINRANISKVFGELITLIESDKRWGNDNKLKIKLASGDEFTIPKNLYILGTMNTADKSISLVDIALRRRFDFIQFYPDYTIPELPEDKKRVLTQINKAIYIKKKSADYLIGHAYFLNNDEIKHTLKSKIIPLLMEYFNGKTEVVEDIFKDTEWRVKYNDQIFNWDITLS